jgi:alkyl hydroperoxide reductase subunit AhpC
VKLVGLSCDAAASAQVDALPVIADDKGDVARLYGLLRHSDG